MMKGMLRVVALLAFLALAAPASGDGGGDSAGGGSTVRFPGMKRAILLDRLTLNPDLASAPVSDEAERSEVPTSGQPEIGSLIASDQRAFDLAREKFEAWKTRLVAKQKPSLLLLAMIQDAMDNMSYLRTTLEFKEISRYDLAPSLKARHPEVKTVILYAPHYLGALISTPEWDACDTETQAGLLVHEAMRQVQGAYQFNDLTDEQVQAITAMIMDVAPSADASFEPYMSPKLARNIRLRALIVGAKSPTLYCDPVTGAVDHKAIIEILPGRELEQIINIQQGMSASQLMATFADSAERERLIQDLIRRGILKRRTSRGLKQAQ